MPEFIKPLTAAEKAQRAAERAASLESSRAHIDLASEQRKAAASAQIKALGDMRGLSRKEYKQAKAEALRLLRVR